MTSENRKQAIIFLGKFDESTIDLISSPALKDQSNITSLSEQWEVFCNEGMLDNIFFEISGIDLTEFTSIENEAERCRQIKLAKYRLVNTLKNQNVDLYPCIQYNKISVLWFPPYPIFLARLTADEQHKLERSIAKFIEGMGLLVHNISFSELTDGSGFEKLFYDHYFMPKQFNEMLGLQQQFMLKEALVELSMEDTRISDFIQRNSINALENMIQNRLQPPFEFKNQVYSGVKMNSTTDFECTRYFIPFFNAILNISENNSLQQIVKLVAKKVEVLDATEVDGKACIKCIAHEGPFAETLGQIIHNIHDLLGPFLLETFKELGLENVRLQFLLNEYYC
jgi:hypothetical protein